jgi:hypothetical protein
MSRVFLAKNVHTNEIVAVKVIPTTSLEGNHKERPTE